MNDTINILYKSPNGVALVPPAPLQSDGVADWALDLANGGGSDPQEREALAWAEAQHREAEPCPACACAIFFSHPDGRIACGQCEPPTDCDKAEKLVLVDMPAGHGWQNYDQQLASQQAHRDGLTGEMNKNDCLVWDTAIEPEWCPTCGGTPWWDGSGRPHCERCIPPNRQELLQSKARHLYAKALWRRQ